MADRRSKYTPERVDKLCNAIKLGATYELACGYAGISMDTFARWRDKYAEFAERIAEAEGTGAVQSLARIQKATQGEPDRVIPGVPDQRREDGTIIRGYPATVVPGKPADWRAAAWVLEHRHPDQYGRSVQDHKHTHTIQTEAERLAKEYGLSVDEVLAEAVGIVKAAQT